MLVMGRGKNYLLVSTGGVAAKLAEQGHLVAFVKYLGVNLIRIMFSPTY